MALPIKIASYGLYKPRVGVAKKNFLILNKCIGRALAGNGERSGLKYYNSKRDKRKRGNFVVKVSRN